MRIHKRNCNYCDKPYQGRGAFYCSISCGNEDRRIKETTKQKLSLLASLRTEEKNTNWKGDKVKYGGLHAWVRKHLGTPNKCEHCGTTMAKVFDWANISRNYLRIITDWLRLCRSCHRKYDYAKC